MINFDNDIKENTPNWTEIPYYPYRILVNGRSRSGKANSLYNLISQQPDVADPYEAKYQFLINKRESTSLNHCIYSKAFIEYSNNV